MIIYRSKDCPPWLVDAPNLCQRSGEAGRYWAIGDPALMDLPATGWVRVDPQTEAVVVGRADDFPLIRAGSWFRCHVATGCTTAWPVPVILSVEGVRAFVAAIGDDWLPVLTDEQTRLVAISTEARALLIASTETDDGIDSAVAARYAAELIAAANHISIDVLRVLHLMDEALVLSALSEATCRG